MRENLSDIFNELVSLSNVQQAWGMKAQKILPESAYEAFSAYLKSRPEDQYSDQDHDKFSQLIRKGKGAMTDKEAVGIMAKTVMEGERMMSVLVLHVGIAFAKQAMPPIPDAPHRKELAFKYSLRTLEKLL